MKRVRPDNSILEGTPEEQARFELELLRLQQQPPQRPKQPASDPAWTTHLVRKFMTTTTPRVEQMIRAAMSLGTGALGQRLAAALKTKSNALGPLVGKVARDSEGIDPSLPKPIVLRGSPGATEIVIDRSFKDAYAIYAQEGGTG